MKIQTVSLEDIATAANVHKTTVSRALRNNPAIPEATRKKIQEAAKRLGYEPNPLLSIYQTHIRSRQKPTFQATLGWINDYPEANNWNKPWSKGLFLGAVRRAKELGYALDPIWLEGIDVKTPTKNIARFLRVLRSRGIFGVVVPTTFSHVHALHPWPGIAVATIGLYHEMARRSKVIPMEGEIIYHSVSYDYFANMRLACERLRAAGYRRIGLIISPYLDTITDQQYHGSYLAQQAGWPRSERLPVLFEAADHSPHFKKWLDKNKPDVVMCQHSETRAWLEQDGYPVPNKIGLAHLSVAPDVAGWSGINPNLEGIGAAAVELLVQQLKMNERQPPSTCHEIYVAGRWISGGTTRTSPPLG